VTFRVIIALLATSLIELNGRLLAAEGMPVRMLLPGFVVQELPIRVTNLVQLAFASDGRLAALGAQGSILIYAVGDGGSTKSGPQLILAEQKSSAPSTIVWDSSGLLVAGERDLGILPSLNGWKVSEQATMLAKLPEADGFSRAAPNCLAADRQGDVYLALPSGFTAPEAAKPTEWTGQSSRGQSGSVWRWSAKTRQLATFSQGKGEITALAVSASGVVFAAHQEQNQSTGSIEVVNRIVQLAPGNDYSRPGENRGAPSGPEAGAVIEFDPPCQDIRHLGFNKAESSKPGNREKKVFGPETWNGNLIAAGRASGTLWRIQLAENGGSYVGRSSVIGRFALPVTAMAIAPSGELYVGCDESSRSPGSIRPSRVFKISFTGHDTPQPMLAWPQSLTELGLLWDRPPAAEMLGGLQTAKLEAGDGVRPGDDISGVLAPCAEAALDAGLGRGELGVAWAEFASDRRLLRLTTDPHAQATRYALKLSGPRTVGSNEPSGPELDYDLTGLAVSWTSASGAEKPAWEGWLPHPDWIVSRTLTAGSSTHAALGADTLRPGTLLMRGLVRSESTTTLRLESNHPFRASAGPTGDKARSEAGGEYRLEFKLTPEAEPVPLAIMVETGGIDFRFRAYAVGQENGAMRPIPCWDFLVPWAQVLPHSPDTAEPAPSTAGDWDRGRQMFFSDQLKCSGCHRIRGEGGFVAADLSNLAGKERSLILREIREPNARINPGFAAFTVTLRDGAEATGIARAEGRDHLKLIGVDGKSMSLPRSEIQDLTPNRVSLMPSGLLEGLDESQIADLLAFLVKGGKEVKP